MTRPSRGFIGRRYWQRRVGLEYDPRTAVCCRCRSVSSSSRLRTVMSSVRGGHVRRVILYVADADIFCVFSYSEPSESLPLRSSFFL